MLRVMMDVARRGTNEGSGLMAASMSGGRGRSDAIVALVSGRATAGSESMLAVVRQSCAPRLGARPS